MHNFHNYYSQMGIENCSPWEHSSAHPSISMADLRVRICVLRSTLTDLPSCHP